MNANTASILQVSLRGLIGRISYRHGLPFMGSVVLAVMTTAWPYVFGATSIWTFALLAVISTAFALLCGGPFRTFFVAIAVTPPFLFVLGWFLSLRATMLYVPGKAVGEYFLYFVAAPILLVWIVATILNRTKRKHLIGG